MARAGSTGKAFYFTEVRVAREDGTDCDADESGEILVKGPHIMMGYWNRPDATAEAVVAATATTAAAAVSAVLRNCNESSTWSCDRHCVEPHS